MTKVWKWTMKFRPTRGWSIPDNSSRRGVSTAPAAMTTWRASMVRVAPSGPIDLDPGGPAPVGAQSRHEGLRQQLGVPRRHGAHEQGHRDRPWRGWGSRRTRRTRSCCTPGARRRAPSSPPWAPRRDAGPDASAAALERTAPYMGAPDGMGYGPERHAAKGLAPGVAGHADGTLDLGVERLEVVVARGPVRHLGAVDGAVGAQEGEVLLPKARHLAVGVGPAPAHRGRDGVDLTHVGALALLLAAAEGAGLDEGVGPEEVPVDELELVVGVVRGGRDQVVGIEKVVAALLDDDHVPARPREHVGGGGAARARTRR